MASDQDTGLAIPPALAAEIQAAADEEHRPPLDVLREAIESYRKEQRWRRTLAYGGTRQSFGPDRSGRPAFDR
jgi:hypothetical protein